MAIENPVSDTSRVVSQEKDLTWPEAVKIQLRWNDINGRAVVRTLEISAAQFFGTGKYGAPLEGQAIISAIENMRRQGPPKVNRRIRSDK